MKTIFNQLRQSARNRVLYHRTLNELSALPRDARRDLAIDGIDLRGVARRAVYGR